MEGTPFPFSDGGNAGPVGKRRSQRVDLPKGVALFHLEHGRILGMLDLDGYAFCVLSCTGGVGVRYSVRSIVLLAHHWGGVLQCVLCTASATSVVFVLFVSDGVA